MKAGLDISINDLEAHFLAGGSVVRVVNAMISADKAHIPLPFQRAAAVDQAGRNVLEAVQMSVVPKVIQTPKIAAVAEDIMDCYRLKNLYADSVMRQEIGSVDGTRVAVSAQ